MTKSSGMPLVVAFLLGGASVVAVIVVLIGGALFIALSGGDRQVSSDEPLSSGTGFVIHPGGYVLTNYHVIEGPGDLFVRIPRYDQTVAAEVVASDQFGDMALIRLRLQPGSKMRTIQLAAESLGRGSRVAAFGYPLGDALGRELKLTTGVVSSLPEMTNDNMLLLDCRVNPGNSGGPLCNTRGEVVGMVTAKSTTRYGLDSYGMAIPAETMRRFLSASCPGYGMTNSPPILDGPGTEWDQVDQLVSPSVVMVIKR